jgi:hypothetical protein
MARRRLTVQQAAEELSLTVDAIRQRVRRESLESEKHDGRVYVWLDDNEYGGKSKPSAEGSELVEVLRDEISHLRRESERKDTILMQLSQANAEQARTIRALEAPEQPSASSESAPDASEGSEPRSDPEGPQTGLQRPWWRRLIGG